MCGESTSILLIPTSLNLRRSIFAVTRRPLMLPEYGNTFQPPNDTPQRAAEVAAMVASMERYSYDGSNGGNEHGEYNDSAPIYAGGLLFEWIDEYWKGPKGSYCEPDPGSAQPYYGMNAVELAPGLHMPREHGPELARRMFASRAAFCRATCCPSTGPPTRPTYLIPSNVRPPHPSACSISRRLFFAAVTTKCRFLKEEQVNTKSQSHNK